MEHPCSFFFRLRFRATANVCRMRSALSFVSQRHTILRSTIARSGRRTVWCSHRQNQPSLGRHEFGRQLSVGSLPHIDLEREPGFRPSLAQQGTRFEMWFQFHHSCCDAIAAVAVIEELFAHYGNATDEYVNVCDNDSGELKRRGTQRLSRVTSVFRTPRDIRRVLRFFANRVTTLNSVPREKELTVGFPAFRVHEFGNLVKRTRRQRKRQGLTVNDLLLHAVFRGVEKYVTRYQTDARAKWLRVAVPLNMRCGPSPQANCVSMVFIDRQPSEIRDANRLLKSLQREMTQVKRHQMGHAMARTLAMADLIPGVLPKLIRRQSSPATTILSNIGCVFPHIEEAVGAELESALFLPPIRRGVAATFGVLTCGDKLSICMHFDPRVMSNTSADWLMRCVSSEATGMLENE